MGPKHGTLAEHSGRDTRELGQGASGGGKAALSELPLARADAAPGLRDGSAEHAGSGPLRFDEIYEQHFAFVWRALQLLGVPSAAVEDLTQDTFNVVLQKLAHFEGRSSIRTWLFAIAQRVAANHRRMARRKTHLLRPLTDSVVSHEPTPHALAEAQECAGVVQRFVASLDAELRTVFVLAVLEQVPAREVAEALRIPVNTVYTRVHHLREALRLAFERHEEAS